MPNFWLFPGSSAYGISPWPTNLRHFSAFRPNTDRIVWQGSKGDFAKRPTFMFLCCQMRADTELKMKGLFWEECSVCWGRRKGSGWLRLSEAFTSVWAWRPRLKSRELTFLRWGIRWLWSPEVRCFRRKIGREFPWTTRLSCTELSLGLRRGDSWVF